MKLNLKTQTSQQNNNEKYTTMISPIKGDIIFYLNVHVVQIRYNKQCK